MAQNLKSADVMLTFISNDQNESLAVRHIDFDFKIAKFD